MLKNIKTDSLLELEKLGLSSLSDALDSLGIEGVIIGIALLSGQQFIGPAYTLVYEPYDKLSKQFNMAANYIDDVPEGAVIVIDNKGRDDCSVWGDILTQVAINKKLKGTVVHGAIRDASRIKQLNYPLACAHTLPRSGKNRVKMQSKEQPIILGNVTISPGDYIFCDEEGALSIPFDLLDEIIKRAKQIQKTEAAILKELSNGSRLDEARSKHHYECPWE